VLDDGTYFVSLAASDRPAPRFFSFVTRRVTRLWMLERDPFQSRNCSSLRNLSFNWRLIMAPGIVLRYHVAHEAPHLAVPDHSRKFWLTVQSICPETERAKQWLSAHGHRLLSDFTSTGPDGLNPPF